MSVRALGLLVLLWCWLPWVAWSEEHHLSFVVIPGGASILEDGQAVDTAPTAPITAYTLHPDIAVVHHYVIHRPPYTDMSVTAQWDQALPAWVQSTASGPVPMGDQTQFDLTRSIDIQTFPPGGAVRVGSESGPALPTRHGMVEVPRAWRPPALYITHPLFDTWLLIIPEGALDMPSAVYPPETIHLRARYGMFSYLFGFWQINITVVALGVLLWARQRWDWKRRWRLTPSPVAGYEPPDVLLPEPVIESSQKPAARPGRRGSTTTYDKLILQLSDRKHGGGGSGAAAPESESKSSTTTFRRFLGKLRGPEPPSVRESVPESHPTPAPVTTTHPRILRQPPDPERGAAPAPPDLTVTVPVSSLFGADLSNSEPDRAMPAAVPVESTPVPSRVDRSALDPTQTVAVPLLSDAEFALEARRHRTPPGAAKAASTEIPMGGSWSDTSWLVQHPIQGQSGRRFVIQQHLGEGSASAVFLATQPGGREGTGVAIKVLLDANWGDEDFQALFIREIRTCTTLTHPAIIKILDWGVIDSTEGARPFVVTEKLEGQTLRDLLRGCEGRPAPLADAVAWGPELLKALDLSHRRGVIHRDVRPENIMILKDRRLKIMDFGMAWGQEPTVYSPPEYREGGRLDAAGDVHAVGVVLYEMLTGQAPFDGADEAWLVSCLEVSGAAPAGLAAELAAVVMTMLAPLASERYLTALDAQRALQAVVDRLPQK